MSKRITVYEKPTCSTCRNLATLFRENGIDYDKVNYFIQPLTEDKLGDLIKKDRPSAVRSFAERRGRV